MEGKSEQFFSFQVEQEDADKGKVDVSPETPEALNEQQEAYRQRAQEFIDGRKRFLATFAGDISLSFKLGTAFYIDLEGGEVNLDTRWFFEKGFSETQILWALLHELSHFRDLAEDKESMMKNFDFIRMQAKQTGAAMMNKWEQKYGATHPEALEKLKKQRPLSKRPKDQGKTMNAVEMAAYKFHHTFYNVFDDINVNGRVARKTATYEPGTAGGTEVKRLYQEKLFQSTEYSELPRHLQFLYKCLREEMVPDEEVTITDEVTEVFERQIIFQGKKYTVKDLIARFIRPQARQNTKAGTRYFALQKTLEPLFLELLGKDLGDWDPEMPPENQQEQQGGEGEGEGTPDMNPFADEYKEFDENSPDQIDEAEIDQWSDKFNEQKDDKKAKEGKKKSQDTKTSEEKAKDAQEIKDKVWCQQNGIEYSTLQNFRKVESEVAPYLQEFSELWRHIIFGASREVETQVQGYFKKGDTMSIPHLVENFPGVVSDDTDIAIKTLERATIMERREVEEVLVKKPDLIRVRLVGDLSGSMDDKKKHILQQFFVLLFSSLQEFNTYLNLTRTQTKSELEVETEGWVFGSTTEKIKHQRKEKFGQDEQIEIVKMFEKLNSNLGTTADFLALQSIFTGMDVDEKQKIQDNKVLDIVFEVTDGGSDDIAKAKTAVDNLLSVGMVARAFQIGAVTEDEKKKFQHVWNDGRGEPLGEEIGENIANLLPAVVKLLKHYLGSVRL